MQYVYYLFVEGENLPFYVGKSFAGSRRLNEHLCRAQKGKTIKDNVIRKAWREGKKVKEVIVATVSTELEAFVIEKALIEHFGRRVDGTGILANITVGGEGVMGIRHSAESKQKMSDAKVGNKINLGRNRPDMVDRFSKPVTVFDENGNILSSYLSQRQAADVLGINYRDINQVLSGRTRSLKRDGKVFQFQYGIHSDPCEPVVYRKRKPTYRIIQLDDSKEISAFDTCKDAAMVLKIPASSIQNCVNGLQKTAGGYQWEKKML